jgi:fructosamine-3-kinase
MRLALLSTWVEALVGQPVRHLTPVGGGCIHSAWQLQLSEGGPLFAKTNRADMLPVLEAEADGLHALAAAACGALTIPRPLHWGRVDGQACLLMEWLPLARGAHNCSDAGWLGLGRGLARLHRNSLSAAPGNPAAPYGWTADNFIGMGPQRNGWRASWGAFFAEQRLGVQLAQAERSGHRLAGTDTLLERVPAWLGDHRVQPVLVHGDLWSGNAALLTGRGDTGAIFDPAVYRGDREVDLAMARLFGGYPEVFFAGYQAEWPLEPGHQERVKLYNLYHLLNHANLFGGSYWPQAQQCIQTLIRRPPIA